MLEVLEDIYHLGTRLKGKSMHGWGRISCSSGGCEERLLRSQPGWLAQIKPTNRKHAMQLHLDVDTRKGRIFAAFGNVKRPQLSISRSDLVGAGVFLELLV